ncbi:MAG: hypothetical protein U0T81_00340 [Saprospiraceae bacterium]
MKLHNLPKNDEQCSVWTGNYSWWSTFQFLRWKALKATRLLWRQLQTVAFALIGAFILSSLSYIPVSMSSWILSRKLFTNSTFLIACTFRVERIYQHALLKIKLHFPKQFWNYSFLLLFLSGWILTRLGGEFIPSLPEGDFAIDTRVYSLAVI